MPRRRANCRRARKPAPNRRSDSRRRTAPRNERPATAGLFRWLICALIYEGSSGEPSTPVERPHWLRVRALRNGGASKAAAPQMPRSHEARATDRSTAPVAAREPRPSHVKGAARSPLAGYLGCPRVRMVLAFIEQPHGAAMKDGLGSIRKGIRGRSGGWRGCGHRRAQRCRWPNPRIWRRRSGAIANQCLIDRISTKDILNYQI